jgi:hypothetical protein
VLFLEEDPPQRPFGGLAFGLESDDAACEDLHLFLRGADVFRRVDELRDQERGLKEIERGRRDGAPEPLDDEIPTPFVHALLSAAAVRSETLPPPGPESTLPQERPAGDPPLL